MTLSATVERLAERLCRDKGYTRGTVAEAQPLADACDLILTRSDGMSLLLVCIVDRIADREHRFALSLDRVVELGRECLAYTGKINGTKLPVGIQIWEVGPAEQAERPRLGALARRFPGLKKVVVSAWQLDEGAASSREPQVWSTARFNGLFAGRSYLAAALREASGDVSRDVSGESGRPLTGASGDRGADGSSAAAARDAGQPWATLALLATLLLAFGAELAMGVRPWRGLLQVDLWTLIATGGLSRGLVEAGQWYRVLIAPLLHADAIHLLCNGVALFMAGVVIEPLLGAAWLMTLYFASACGGAAASLLVNPPTVTSVGASGAIMGLLAAALVGLRRLPFGRERTEAQMGLLRVFIPSLLPLVAFRSGGAGGRIDIAAHVGGALVGGLFGWTLTSKARWPSVAALPRGGRIARAVALAALVGVVYGGFRLAAQYPMVVELERAQSRQNPMVEP